MNTVRRCLFLVLFALLARPAFAAPGAATLIAPSGEVVGTTIAFSWQSVPESTWYLFWLGKGTPTAFIMQQWYSADQAGCANGGTCTVAITPPINAGSHTWFIQTWAAGVTGPWSPGLQFVVTAPHWSSKLPDSRRFTLVLGDEGVLDHETGLVWQRNPAGSVQWPSAQLSCANYSTVSRHGWRVPTLSELQSLLDSSRSNPTLPAGHPFLGNLSNVFWTQTEYHAGSGHYLFVSFFNGTTGAAASDTAARYWCVRAASAGGQ